MARKTEKCGKFRNVHGRTWNIARKLKIKSLQSHRILAPQGRGLDLDRTVEEVAETLRNTSAGKWRRISLLTD